jgi:hypothetical protein
MLVVVGGWVSALVLTLLLSSPLSPQGHSEKLSFGGGGRDSCSAGAQ